MSVEEMLALARACEDECRSVAEHAEDPGVQAEAARAAYHFMRAGETLEVLPVEALEAFGSMVGRATESLDLGEYVDRTQAQQPLPLAPAAPEDLDAED